MSGKDVCHKVLPKNARCIHPWIVPDPSGHRLLLLTVHCRGDHNSILAKRSRSSSSGKIVSSNGNRGPRITTSNSVIAFLENGIDLVSRIEPKLLIRSERA